MKKLLCLVMSVLMAVPLMMTAFAVEQKTEAEFEKYNLSAETEVNGGGTDYDRGRSVMLSMGFDEDLVDSMDRDHVASYADVTEAVGLTQYYRVHYTLDNEIKTRSSEDHVFIEVTPEDEDHLVASVQPVTKEEYERLSQEVVKLQEEGNRVATMDLIQKEKVFDGFMTLQAKAAKISTSRYKISGTYEWTTRPQGFGTIFKGLRQDIFTIAPDAHGRFSNSTMYAIRKVDWARTVTDAQGVRHMTYGNNNKDFNGANSMTFREGGGFGIDIPIEYSSTGDGYSYKNYNGYIGGEMLISEDNLKATLKICVDYAKNTKKIGSISSISVSIPPSLSISFSSGGDKYTVQESALMFHVPDFRKVS
jgi:hypothetical protein